MERTPEVITKLVADLQSDDEFVRSQAAFALGIMGEPAVPALLPLLRVPDRDMRLRAAWTLGVIGGPAIPALLELLEQPFRQLRIEAIRILGVIGEARSINHLFVALTDFDPEIAARSARSLGKIGDPRAFHPLLAALHHPEADVRYEAALALGQLHQPEAIGLLEEALATESDTTSWGGSVAEALLRAIVETATPSERSFMADLDQLGPILDKLKHEHDDSATLE